MANSIKPIIVADWVIAVSITSTPTAHSAETSPSRFQNFVTRQGARLYDGEKVFRFVGANMPDKD